MKYSRVIGYNVNRLMGNVSRKELAQRTGYSTSDIQRILEGRLLLTPMDVQEIASALGVQIKELVAEDSYLNDRSLGSFKNIDNREKILDIIDTYIDMREANNEK